MFVIDITKEIALLCVVVLFATVLSAGFTSWNSLPEYVWHLKGQ
jgi:hypothetical protein